MTRVLLLVGTPKGAFILESDAERRSWTTRGPLCEGWPIHDLIVEPDTGAILAGGGSPWYGPAVWRSEDLGETWTHSSEGLAYPGDGVRGGDGQPAQIATVWSLATTPDCGTLAGVEPAGLFRSDDRGATWSHVEGLSNHETRDTWGPGAGGLILHTIVPHPEDASRTWVGISAVGVFESQDGGATWEPRNRGVRADFDPNPDPITGQCVHKFAPAAGEPETLYQQNHCGMYRSQDGGLTWQEVTKNGLPSQFGFPLVTHPRDPKTWWIIPLNGDDRGRYVPDASAAVWKTTDRGDTWTRHGEGLPQDGAYLSVLREAMARDTLDPVGITFGTKTGQLWHSRDEGASWERITADLPEIWAVEAVVVD
jgi:photosystem II stability/assembly factor-like uncharacterized protein